jgi:hypothetical protein
MNAAETLTKALSLLVEARPLFVAASTDLVYSEYGRESYHQALAALDAAVGTPTLEAFEELVIEAEILTDDSAKGRGLRGRLRRFGVATWPDNYSRRGKGGSK